MSTIDAAKKILGVAVEISTLMPKHWTAYVVGGAVRDILYGICPHDIDIEIFNAAPDGLVAFAKGLDPKADVVGKAFGVVKLTYNGVLLDLSLPRRETKRGEGHKGFDVEPDPGMSTEEACKRRDFTINSMMLRLPDMELIDHYGGRRDIQFHSLRPTSSHFVEDPLRILRGMQFAARFRLAYTVTFVSCGIKLRHEYDTLPKERIWHEWYKLACAQKPSMGLETLRGARWLDTVPYLEQLVELEQDVRHHPEGWSVDEPLLPVEPSLACSAETVRVDLLLSGDLTPAPPAISAVVPRGTGTSNTQPSMDDAIHSFSSTNLARALGVTPPLQPGVAISTQPKRFMWTSGSTLGAHKRLRIMVEVPVSRVLRVMKSSVYDLEVIKRIIHPVAVYVMNVLGSAKLSANRKFHEISMKPDTAALPVNLLSEIDVLISSIVVDLESVPVNNHVLLNFDLALEGDFDFAHVSSCDIDYDTTHTVVCKPSIGDVWQHTLYAVDAVVRRQESLLLPLSDEDRAICVFAALCHDLGKISTTVHEDDGSITSRAHDIVGEDMASEFMDAIGAPKEIALKVSRLVRQHMRHIFTNSVSRRTVRRLSRDLAPATIEQWGVVAYADHSSRPPRPEGMHKNAQAIMDMARGMSIELEPPKYILMGRHLIEIGLSPGKEFGVILKAAYEAQLDGMFYNIDGARKWAEEFIARELRSDAWKEILIGLTG